MLRLTSNAPWHPDLRMVPMAVDRFQLLATFLHRLEDHSLEMPLTVFSSD